ncbi:hypothetical protein KTN05_13650 [Paracoccus sp. Z118]|uniref:hypothetical protein n=1 Tax=Paracoccus sp. Z118 TaxID=2851017 RepID=UPI001C2B8C38|nr:hypothetical protein [Paracoccus sp. Z118]MBV0892887.1 hypothetical protein [Paracoccus sp. Z118]
MTRDSRPTLLLAATLLAALISPASAQTTLDKGAPNEVAGHLTNAFLPGFPEKIDELARSSIQSRPQEGRIMATYGSPEDDRNMQVLLYPLDERGIEGNIARADTYMAGGEIPVIRESVESPGGLKMHCMTSRVGELGYNLCIAEIYGRALNVQIGDVVSPDAAELPRDVVQRARALAGEVADTVAAAPGG